VRTTSSYRSSRRSISGEFLLYKVVSGDADFLHFETLLAGIP
jgi:hypothetical protein